VSGLALYFLGPLGEVDKRALVDNYTSMLNEKLIPAFLDATSLGTISRILNWLYSFLVFFFAAVPNNSFGIITPTIMKKITLN
jgi:hypothetical protein